jgi:hypothetical protein
MVHIIVAKSLRSHFKKEITPSLRGWEITVKNMTFEYNTKFCLGPY